MHDVGVAALVPDGPGAPVHGEFGAGAVEAPAGHGCGGGSDGALRPGEDAEHGDGWGEGGHRWLLQAALRDGIPGGSFNGSWKSLTQRTSPLCSNKNQAG